MLNIIIVSDDLDVSIGPNCQLSHQHFTKEVNLENDNVILLSGDRCTAEEVQQSVSAFAGGRFIVIAFSHGSEEALISTVEINGYINATNSYFFSSSLIYTNCCYSGLKLMDLLVGSGCSAYVGYTNKVHLPINENDEILFIACENSGLINLLNTNESLTESINVMRNKYQEQCKSFIDQNMNLAAAFLLRNLNCLTFYDNDLLTREYFEN